MNLEEFLKTLRRDGFGVESADTFLEELPKRPNVAVKHPDEQEKNQPTGAVKRVS